MTSFMEVMFCLRDPILWPFDLDVTLFLQKDDDDEDKNRPDPHLEQGKPLPPKLANIFPSELYGKPIEDLDEFYHDKYVSAFRDTMNPVKNLISQRCHGEIMIYSQLSHTNTSMHHHFEAAHLFYYDINWWGHTREFPVSSPC